MIGSTPPPRRMDQSFFQMFVRLSRKSKQSGLSQSKKGFAKRKTILGFALLGIRWDILKAKTQKNP